jgi:Protein of unknown function (DUF3152)
VKLGIHVILCALMGLPVASQAGSVAATTPSEGVVVEISIESQLKGVSSAEFSEFVVTTLNDPRGWPRAGFRFVSTSRARFKVVLAEPVKVDALCRPLKTGGTVSCQNGPTVALNADRWRSGVAHWDASLDEYRTYLVNHEVGHLIGQFHPAPRCPKSGGRAAVMEQQSKSLDGCLGNPWPLQWEIDQASKRPTLLAPGPEVKRDIENLGDDGSDPQVSAITTEALLLETTTFVPATPETSSPASIPENTMPPPSTLANPQNSNESYASIRKPSRSNTGTYLIVAALGGLGGLLTGLRWHYVSSKPRNSRRSERGSRNRKSKG